ncbi:hypothetical protein FBU30_009373 [Linnemannia zychae]|nr:hypothetical protein FBU30_009373 [Linnemannia zychae]
MRWTSIFENSIILKRLGLDEMEDSEIIKLYLADRKLWPWDAKRGRKPIIGARMTISQRLRRELIILLVTAKAEHLQSVDIPLSDISTYLPLISRFKSLISVRFLLDRDFERNLRQNRILTPDEQAALMDMEDEHNKDLENMILFVHEHRRVHPNVLNMARCESVGTKEEKCPAAFQSRLVQALPPLKLPRFLDKSNWLQFATYFQDTDISQVKTISIPQDLISLPHFKIREPFLYRCRLLQDINIFSWDKDLFQWSVDDNSIYIDAISNGNIPEQRLVRLRNAEIHYTDEIYEQQVNDLLLHCPQITHICLCDSLEVYRLDEIEYWLPSDLPNLETLQLEGTPAVSFHPDTLHTTSKLVSLTFDIPTSIPSLEAFIRAEEDAKHLDELTPPTTQPRLSLRERPTWTWDWDLPNLVRLTLIAEFAYQFQFKMLDKTPNLKYLYLDIDTPSRDPKRVVELIDLIKPGSQQTSLSVFLLQEQGRPLDKKKYGPFPSHHTGVHISNSEGIKNKLNTLPLHVETVEKEGNEMWKNMEYIHVPKLNELQLVGPWILEERAMNVLFEIVAPGVNKK